VAHGTLFLRSVRQTVRRGGIPRTGGPPVLPGRLLRHVRAQVRRLQPAHNGELRVGPVRPMAFQLLRVQGKRRRVSRSRALVPFFSPSYNYFSGSPRTRREWRANSAAYYIYRKRVLDGYTTRGFISIAPRVFLAGFFFVGHTRFLLNRRD